METTDVSGEKPLQKIELKVEKAEKSIETPSNNDIPKSKIQEEVWIKPDIKEEPKEVSENAVEIEIIPEQQPQIDKDENPQQTISSLPPKKRKTTLDKSQIDVKPEGEEILIKEEQIKSEPNSEGNDQTQKAEDDKPKEQYIMYSYETIKNIQIVTITEEERQIEHVQNVKSRQHMRFVCEDCALGFVLEHAYRMHMKVHSKEAGEFECDICHCHLKSADMLYRHKLRHYRRYRCLLCWERFKDKDTAACHVMSEHDGTAFKCEHCGRVFKRPQYLKRHVEQYHTKPHRLECSVCFRVFYEKGWYRSHIRTHNEEIRASAKDRPKMVVKCDICSRSFNNKQSLKRHLVSHDVNLPCALCDAVCKNRTVLGHHYWNVHNEKLEGSPQETCTLCLRVCATKAMLTRHVRRMHSDRTKKYQCDHCQRYYLTKGEVRSHISWSHAIGPRVGHACECGRLFRTPSLLKDHTARFHNMQPPPRNHECEHCGKAFTNKQVLNRHKKSHSDEMYPCNECGLLFKTQPYVKVHYQIKHMNMTRAEIKAQKQLNKINKIPQNNLHVQPNWEQTPEQAVESEQVQESSSNPLFVDVENLQVKIESMESDEDMQVPLFQSFVDVAK